MGHFLYPAVVDFGRSRSNATGSTGVGYTIYDKHGNAITARSTHNVVQVSPGIYSVPQINFSNSLHSHDFFNIVWDTGSAFPKTSYASETVIATELSGSLTTVLSSINNLSSSIEQNNINISQGFTSISSSINQISDSIENDVVLSLESLSSSLVQIGDDVNQTYNAINSIIPDLSQLLRDVEIIKDFTSGRWRMHNNQMIFYKEDNITEIARFDLFDDAGGPSMESVFERRKV